MKVRKKVAAFMVMAACLCTACAGNKTAQTTESGSVAFTEEEKKIVTFSRPEDLLNLDPHDHTNNSNIIVDRCIYDTLFELTENGIEPGLVSEYEFSEGNTKMDLKLREGIKFHNGENFTAESVKVSLDRLIEGKVRFATYLATLESCGIISDYECMLTFSSPSASILNDMTLIPMIPPKAYQEQGTALFEHPIGTGPFKFVEWQPKVHVILEKNTEYWGERQPQVSQITYLPLVEDSTRTAAILAGEIDIATSVPQDQLAMISKDSSLQVVRQPIWDQTYIMFNTTNDVFKDQRVREAFSLAIDRDAIVKSLTGSRASNQMLPEGMVGFDSTIPAAERDIERAKQLVEEAGAVGKEIVIKASEGSYSKLNETLSVISEQVSETGLKCSFQTMDTAAFYEARIAGNYDCFFVGGAYVAGAVSNNLTTRIIDDIYKSGYVNQELNDLLKEALSTIDDDKRAEMLGQASRIVLEEVAPWTFIYQQEGINVQNSSIGNIFYRGDGIPDIRWVTKE